MFHWICPECGREIPPKLKECPACDPHSVVQAEPAASPVAVTQVAAPVVEAASPTAVPLVDRSIEPSPVLEAAPVMKVAPIVEPAPVLSPPRVVEAPRVVEPVPVVEAAPVIEAPPVVEPVPVVEAAPVVEVPRVVEPVPVMEAAPVVEAPPAVEPVPVVKATPVVAAPPIIEPVPVVKATPVVAAPPIIEPVPVVEAAPVVAAPPIIEPVLVVEAAPVVAPPIIEPVPVVEAAPVVETAPPVVKARRAERIQASPAEPPSLPELDPMLALAEQVRRAQSVPPPAEPKGAPVSSPQPDFAELATAVGLTELAPEPATVEAPSAAVEPEPHPAAVSAAQPLLSPQPAPQALLAAPAPMALLAAPVSAPAPISEVGPVVAAAPAPVATTLTTPEPPPAAPEPAAPPIGTTQFGLRFPVAVSGANKPIQFPEPVPGPAAAPPQSPNVASDTLPSGSWLRLAPLQDYTAAAERGMKPIAPAAQILTADSGPRMTLPGPALPPKLARFQEGNIITVIGDSPRGFHLPGWLISATVMLSVLLIAATLVFYFFPVAKSSAETKTPVEDPHLVTPAAASHPLAQFIEVTGFRFVVDLNKKSEIHYLVVNHSAADVSDVTVFVTLRTGSSKPGQPPVARFSFRAPSLGPFESKEMTSSIEKIARPVSLPDWQDLRSEVQIAQ